MLVKTYSDRYFTNNMTDEKSRVHRAEMIHQMELYLGYKEKCRRGELLKHFEPGSSGDSLGILRRFSTALQALL